MGFYHNGYVWAQQVYAENNLQIIKSWKQIRDFKKVPKVSGEGDSPNKETFHLCPRLWLMLQCYHLFICKCEWVCVSVCSYVCNSASADHTAVCDPQCHAQNIVSHWARLKKKKKNHKKATHVLFTSISKGRQQRTRQPKCHHSFLWSTWTTITSRQADTWTEKVGVAQAEVKLNDACRLASNAEIQKCMHQQSPAATVAKL